MAPITIGITAYREGALLQRAIDGMLSQSIRDWKGYIVVDGGGSDKTREVAENVRDPRVEVIFQDENTGPYPTREAIFSRSPHDIILHCDADDCLRPEAAEVVLDTFAKTGAAYAGFGAKLHYPDRIPRIIEGHRSTLKNFILYNDFPGYVLFLKSIWEKYQGYHRELLRGKADFELIMRLIHKEEPFAFSEHIIIDKYERRGSVQTSYQKELGNKHQIIVDSNPEVFSDPVLRNNFLLKGYRNSAWHNFINKEFTLSRINAVNAARHGSSWAVWPLQHLTRFNYPVVSPIASIRYELSNLNRLAKRRHPAIQIFDDLTQTTTRATQRRINPLKTACRLREWKGIRRIALKYLSGPPVPVYLKKDSRHPIWCRRDEFADFSAIHEIFYQKIYDLTRLPWKPDIIIDAGAHIGVFTRYCLSEGMDCEINAFEPDSENFKLLTRNLGHHNENITLKNVALGLSEHEAVLGGPSSMGRKLGSDVGERVQVRRLSTETSLSQCKRLLLKLDVEGSEWHVLDDIAPFLPADVFIFMELHDPVSDKGRLKKFSAEQNFEILEYREIEDAVISTLSRSG